MSRRLLALAVLAWTAVSWGGRVGLLTTAEAGEPWTLVRVTGSLLVGVATAAVLARPPGWEGPVLGLFVGWTVVVWTRALLLAWVDSASLGFSLVHTVLAVGWFALAALVLTRLRAGRAGPTAG